MIDTHCHLYSDEFGEEKEQVVLRAIQKGIKKFYFPAIDSNHTDKMLQLEALFPEHCYSMMGLHPCSVNENYKKELELVNQWLQKRKFAAVGEVGLDFYWDKTFTEQQYIAFRYQIELALEHSLPVVIHSRNATPETISVIKEYRGSGLSGIFHCFGGNLHEANQIIESGFLLGIGGVITYKNSGLAEVIADIDLQYLVLETDAPYLSPVPYRGKRNETAYLPYIAEKIATVKKSSVEEVIRITSENADSLFKL